MFNKKLKEEAIKTLQKAEDEYNKQLKDSMHKMEELQEIRDSSVKIINDVKHYKSDLKNSPKVYDTTIAQATARCDHFNERIKMLKENFQSKFHPVRSTGTYHEKLLGLELTMRIFLVERAHHGLFC